MAETFERRRARVYIAGPISKGDRYENIQRGIVAGRRMVRDGLAPMVPHLDSFMFPSQKDLTWEVALTWDLEYVSIMDAVFRLAGESAGADKEVAVARELGIPVFHEYRWDDPIFLEYPDQVDYDHDWPDYLDMLEYLSLKGLVQRAALV